MKSLFLLVLSIFWAHAAYHGAYADTQRAADLRTGDMRNLIFHDEPQATSKAPFEIGDGQMASLQNWQGKVLLVNFWATWCAPCRHEMPMLAKLQDEFEGDDFALLTIATGRNPPAAINAFFDEIDADNLPRYRDPKQKLASEMGIFGLPITVIIDRQGNEIARLRGDADWSSQSARDIIAALIGTPQ